MAKKLSYPTAITIENLKCFRSKQRIDFSSGDGHAKWTIILGNNGTGKTTVLQAIYGSLSFKEYAINNEHTIDLPLLFDTRGAFPKNPQFKVETHFGKESAFILETGRFAPRHFRSLKQVPIFAYTSGRTLEKSDEWDPENHISHEDFSSGESQKLSNPSLWLADLHHKKVVSKSAKFAKHLDTVTETLIRVLPDIADIIFPKPTALDSEPVLFKTPYGNVAPDNLSHGYKTLIAWLIDLVRRMIHRYPRAKDPLAMPAIVLVDEIDLHLHPSWQRKLIKYLDERFKKTQFIVTAHSPLIAQSNPDARIVLLERRGKETIVRQDLDSIKHWRLDQILQSDLFGFETLSSPAESELQEVRRALLRKKRLSATEKKKLEKLNVQLSELVPLGSNDIERRIFELAKKAAGKNGGGT